MVLTEIYIDLCMTCVSVKVIILVSLTDNLYFMADGEGTFPLVMVGGVLEANRRWDIGKEVINCISKHFPGVLSIRPKVSLMHFIFIILIDSNLYFHYGVFFYIDT